MRLPPSRLESCIDYRPGARHPNNSAFLVGSATWPDLASPEFQLGKRMMESLMILHPRLTKKLESNLIPRTRNDRPLLNSSPNPLSPPSPGNLFDPALALVFVLSCCYYYHSNRPPSHLVELDSLRCKNYPPIPSHWLCNPCMERSYSETGDSCLSCIESVRFIIPSTPSSHQPTGIVSAAHFLPYPLPLPSSLFLGDPLTLLLQLQSAPTPRVLNQEPQTKKRMNALAKKRNNE